MNFRVGQRVVCVEGITDPNFSAPLVERGIYTIRAIQPIGVGWPVDIVGVCVEEILGRYEAAYDLECSFRASRFCPLIERKTDIGFAHEILRKATRKRSVDA